MNIKKHLQENKKAYFVGAGCLVVGAVGGYLAAPKVIQIVDSFKLINYKSPHTSTNVLQLVPRGHRGNVIECLETGEKFASQGRAAEANNINPARLSEHLNGKNSHAGGLHFKSFGELLDEVA